jgi:hypothetical protein
MREIEKEKEAAKRRSIVSLPENLSNQIHDNSSKILPQTSSIEVIAPVVDLEDLHKENKLQEIGKKLNMPPAKVPLLDSTIKFNSTCVPPIDNQKESIGAGSQEESLPIKAPLVELTHPIEEIPQHFDTKMDLKELEPAVVSPMLQMNSPPKKNRRVSLNSSTDQVKDHWDALEEDEQEDFRIQHRLPQARGRTRRPQTRGRTSSQRRQSRRLEDGSVNERETCAADMDMDTDQDDPLYNSDSNNFSKRYGHPSRRYSVDEEEEEEEEEEEHGDYSYSDEEDEFEDFNQQEKEENSRRKNRRSILSQRESFSNKSSRLLSSLTSLDDSTELKSAQQREQDAIWNLLFN